MDDAVSTQAAQAAPQVARELEQELERFLAPVVTWLDTVVDKRLTRTLVRSIVALLEWRNRAHGLLLSELGAYICDPAHAPAGTKRLSNLLRSPKWEADGLSHALWRQAAQGLATLEAADETPLLIWDTSVLEKPESLASPDLGSVRSSKAQRLTHLKPGFYHPPTRPLFVPGWRWIGLLLVGLSSASAPPCVAHMRWWTTRGPHASDQDRQQREILQVCAQTWRRRVLHVWDRGYTGRAWLTLVLAFALRFVVRWPKRYRLLSDRSGTEPVPAWRVAQGLRAWEYRLLWDARRQVQRRTGVVALPVWRPEDTLRAQPLWLVVVRRGQGQEPWYLLTTEPVTTPEQAWQIVYAYARRWQIEWAWRYGKSELALESPRVWSWERRQKFLLLATLAYAFLLSLLRDDQRSVRQWLLRYWCHRTGKRSRAAAAPLYRLRSALSRLWLAYLALPSLAILQNSG
jgi:Transposase DDE domain